MSGREQGKPAFCLVMIVKDEAHCIERALRSVIPHIHHWVIVDTGSSDDTKEIILETMKEIPGRLYERKWVNFALNRNEALKLAQSQFNDGYFLSIDADEEFEGDLSELHDDRVGEWLIYCNDGNVKNSKSFLLKSCIAWAYVGDVHECAVSILPTTRGILKTCELKHHADGARHKSDWLIDDIHKLLDHTGKNPWDARALSLLAESAYIRGLWDLCYVSCVRRARLEGNPEEKWRSLYLLGRCSEEMGFHVSEVVKAYEMAVNFRPQRPEAIRALAACFDKMHRHKEAENIRTLAARIPLTDTLYIERDAYAILP